jgi:predicted  nucleic acid-binding Zn-ribbon protein
MASSMWIAIAVIAVVSIIGRTVVAIIKASNSGGQFKPRMEDLEEQVHDLENDLQDARHRVEVLEKIVTSQKYDLGREIDELQSN